MSAPYSFITNAIIDSVTLEIERGFVLTGHVFLNFEGGSQGYGGYALGGVGDAKCANHAEQPNLAAMWITGILRAAGEDSFFKLKGRVVRIGKDEEFGPIRAIGHPIKNDRWFDFQDEFASLQSPEKPSEGITA